MLIKAYTCFTDARINRFCNVQVCRQRMSCFYVACLLFGNPFQYVHDGIQMVKIGKRFILISDVPTNVTVQLHIVSFHSVSEMSMVRLCVLTQDKVPSY